METQRDWEHGAPEETGSGGLRGQTDACGCSGAGREGGASTRRWTLVQQKKKELSGYLYHPILGGLPNSAILPHSGWLGLQDTRSGPRGPIHGFLLWEQEEPTSRAAADRKAEGRAKLHFPGIASRWRALFVAHGKCLRPDFSAGSTGPVMVLIYSIHFLYPPKPPSVNKADK